MGENFLAKSRVLRVGPGQSRLTQACDDIAMGVGLYSVWGVLGWHDIRNRYRRSVLGPFWLTISTGVMIAMLGFLYGALFGQPIRVFLPFVGAGLVVWMFIATLINEACSVFQTSESIIKQVRAPLTMHVCRMVWRNTVVFLHNAVIMIPVVGLAAPRLSADLLLVPLAVVAIAVNGVWAGLALGVLCARFRDIPLIISNLVQIVFFVTPIMWLPEILHARGVTWVSDVNPFYHFIEIVRAPLLDKGTPELSWSVVIVVTALGWAFALTTLRRYRHRVAYWL
jgi:lipopolysaccharide transport system permease protein